MVKNAKNQTKSLESWIWDAACSIRGAKDAPKFKDFILPLIFLKRLSDVYDDEIKRIAENVGNRTKAFALVEKDRKLVRFYLPFKPANLESDEVWSVIRKLSNKIGEQLTTNLRDVARENPSLSGIIDRVDFNATTHGQRDIDDDRLSNLIERISEKRLGLKDVEPDIIGRSYEYLIRKFAENSGKSAGEFYTPAEVGMMIAKIMDPDEGMEIYDPTCGSAGLLIKCQIALDEKTPKGKRISPLQLYGQEFLGDTWAMAKMNMIVHDMEGEIEIGDTMKYPKFLEQGKLKKYDIVVANPMWNQGKEDGLPYLGSNFYQDDTYNRFLSNTPSNNADWAWMQHILESLKDNGRASVILGTGSSSRGSNKSNDSEKLLRKHFLEKDYIEAVILLPFNLFYNTDAPGVVYILNKYKSPDRKGKVLFINASNSFIKGKPKNILEQNSLQEIINVYKDYKEIAGFSRIVEEKLIEDQNYVLNPSRYVYQIHKINALPLNKLVPEYLQLNKEIDLLQNKVTSLLGRSVIEQNDHNKVDSIFGSINSNCKLEPLINYVEEFKSRAGNTEYPVLSCSKVYGVVLQSEKFKNVVASKNKSNYKIVKPNMFVYDPMLLWDGSIGRNRYSFDGIVSPAYTVFKVKEGSIDLDYLQFVLNLNIMLPFYVSISDGTNMRRRKAKFEDFLTLKIPIFDEKIQQLIAQLIKYNLLISNQEKTTKNLISSLFKKNFEDA